MITRKAAVLAAATLLGTVPLAPAQAKPVSEITDLQVSQPQTCVVEVRTAVSDGLKGPHWVMVRSRVQRANASTVYRQTWTEIAFVKGTAQAPVSTMLPLNGGDTIDQVQVTLYAGKNLKGPGLRLQDNEFRTSLSLSCPIF